MPSFKCIQKVYDNNYLLKYAFASDLEYIIANYNIDLWVFGHTHESVDIEINNTRVISNALGYIHESQKDFFKNDLIVELT